MNASARNAAAAFAVLAALWNRERTGYGDYIDLSQIEALTTYIGPQLIQAQLTGRDPERQGNRRAGFVPHGLFPCQPGGRFVAMDVAAHSPAFLGPLLAMHSPAPAGHARGDTMVDKLTPMLQAAGFSEVEGIPTRHRSFAFVRAR